MKLKRGTLFLMVLVATLALVLAGCGNLFGSDDDDNPALEVGDTLPNGAVVTYIDPAGGVIAERDGVDHDGLEDTDTENQSIIRGDFVNDVTMDSDRVWYIDGPLVIGNNENAENTLTVEAGTLVKGEPGTGPSNTGVLIISRGSKIAAEGTAADPIIFTSAKAPAFRAPGDWGGLVINGYARVQGGTAEGEGDSGTYGGDDDEDDSGVLKYVSVQFAGTQFTPENELNGIAFQGVGSGTTVENIHVHRNADDGIEFFGGSVQVKYYIGTGIQDDSIDADDGWNGSVQYAAVQQWDDGDKGFEFDGDAEDVFPPSNGVVANVTVIGHPGSATKGPAVLHLKSDADQQLYNILVHNPTGPAIDDTDGATPTYNGVLLPVGADEDSAWADGSNGNAFEDVAGLGVFDADADNAGFDMVPASISASAVSVPATDPHGNSLDDTNFIGAVDPAGTNWTAWVVDNGLIPLD